ncbi:MAG: hypothetical protein ACKVOU_08975, partial [Cytophagales bacterium]
MKKILFFVLAVLLINFDLLASAGSNATVCGSSYQLNATPLDANEVGNWTRISGAGTFTNTASPTSSITGLAQNANILRWTVTNTVTSNVVTAQVAITNNRPNTPTTTPAVFTSCESNFAIRGSVLAANVTGVWTVLSGVGSFVSPSLRINTVVGLSQGQNLLGWIVTRGECSLMATADIYYNKPAFGGSNQEVCGNMVVMNALDNGVASLYYWEDESNNLIGDDPYSSTTTIQGLNSGLNVFKWVTEDNDRCVSQISITSNIVTPSNAGSNQILCSNTTTLSGNNPTLGTGFWSILGTNSGHTFLNQSVSGTAISNIPEGNSVLEWKVSKGTCESASTVTITNNAPTEAQVGADQFICLSSTTLSGNVPTQGVGRWHLVSGTGTFSDPFAANTSVSGILVGSTNQYMWSISFPGCAPSSKTITVTRQNPEVAAIQTNYFQICNTNIVSITGLNTTVGIGLWQTVTGFGTIANPTSARTTVLLNGDGRTELIWTINISGCASTFATLIIDHNTVTLANAGANQILCTDQAILNGNTPTNGTGNWTLINTLSGTVLSPSAANATVTGLNPDINVLQWEISSAHCSSTSLVTITNNQPTTAATASNQTLCINQGSLEGNVPLQGVGTWTVVSGVGTIVGINNPTTLGSNLANGNNTFRWTINKNGCISSADQSLFNNTPSIAQSNSDAVVCTPEAILVATSPLQGTGTWSKVITSTTGVIANPLAINTSVTGLSQGINLFQWSVSTTGCP